MNRKNGPWTIKGTSQKFKDDFIEVNQDEVIKPDGTAGAYATVLMKNGVCILPVDENGDVHLVKQFRYVVGRDSIEVVCGAIEEGEDVPEAARREVHEELGIEAKNWTPLGTIDVDTSIVRCTGHLFLARNLDFKKPEREATEVMQTLKMKLSDAVEKVLASEITHSLSCALILKAHFLLNRQSR